MMQYRGIRPLQRASRACFNFKSSLIRSHASTNAPPLEPLVPPAPGTVKEHFHHILIKLNSPDNTAEPGHLWWPNKVERHPTILKAFRSLASYRAATGNDSGLKITAFDVLEKKHNTPTTTASSSTNKPENEDSCDLFIFPAGIRYHYLPVSLLDEVVVHGISGGGGGGSTMTNLPSAALQAQEQSNDPTNTNKLYIFVCAHGSRDARCGVLGTALAQQLEKIIAQRQLANFIEVYTTSHIGGHKYAGNVVVYGRSHPADGDWYGGLHAAHAEVFLDALLNMEIGVDGGAEDPMLREFWRGRIGLSKEEQVELWESGGGVESGAESEEEEEEEGEKNP